ncbi:MAG: hypothetical protein CYPHOPRED_004465, partial [Cyphobasidiales sp. Tagirdzhanova-0007]
MSPKFQPSLLKPQLRWAPQLSSVLKAKAESANFFHVGPSVRRRPTGRRNKYIRLIFFMAYIMILNQIWHHSKSLLKMLHDETAPSPHFWTFAPNPDSLVVLRPWHWPRFYEVTEGYTKIHMRRRPISLLR